MKQWMSALIVLVVAVVGFAVATKKFNVIEGFKGKDLTRKIKLGNGQTFITENLCPECRAKPKSQVTIDNCVCNGSKMQELTLPKHCRDRADRLQYVDNGPRTAAQVICLDNRRREVARLQWARA